MLFRSAAVVFGGLVGLVLLAFFVLRVRRQSMQLGKMQMELTQMRSRSMKLETDDEPTVDTNTRSAPYEQEPEEPSSTVESVSVVLDELPTTLQVTRVAKPSSARARVDPGLDSPAVA